MEENQFLLLIDVPIQDRAQQIQIYQIINLPVPVGNYSMRYTLVTKYLGVTYDRTKAMDIPEEQFKLCKEANGQFCPLLTPLPPLTNPPSCVAALYTKNSKEIVRRGRPDAPTYYLLFQMYSGFGSTSRLLL